MKKLIALFLAFVLIFTGCNASDKKDDKNTESTDTKEETKKPEETGEKEKETEDKETTQTPTDAMNQGVLINENLYLVKEGNSGKYQLVYLSNGPKEIKPGESIKFSYNGGVKESMPAQAEAKDIEIVKGFVKGLKIDLVTAENIKQFGGDKISILDVRTKEEYEEGHIKDSELMPLDSLNFDIAEKHDKDQILIVYCRSGNRSDTAQKILEKQEYFSIDAGGIDNYEGELVK